MINKKLIMLSCLIAAMSVTPVSLQAEEISTEPIAITTENTMATPYKDRIDYVYKIVDGVLWRRLYNFSLGIWVGEWEIAP